jgi:hypothetical protein
VFSNPEDPPSPLKKATVYTQVLESHLKLAFVALAPNLWREVDFQAHKIWAFKGQLGLETYAVSTCVYTVALKKGGYSSSQSPPF